MNLFCHYFIITSLIGACYVVKVILYFSLGASGSDSLEFFVYEILVSLGSVIDGVYVP